MGDLSQTLHSFCSTFKIARLNITVSPPGKVGTLTSDHGGEVLSTAFRTWLRVTGIFHMTAAVKEPNYNAVIE